MITKLYELAKRKTASRDDRHWQVRVQISPVVIAGGVFTTYLFAIIGYSAWTLTAVGVFCGILASLSNIFTWNEKEDQGLLLLAFAVLLYPTARIFLGSDVFGLSRKIEAAVFLSGAAIGFGFSCILLDHAMKYAIGKHQISLRETDD